jgi:hypothetical protein
VQARIDLRVSSDEAAVERRDGELDVILIEASAIVNGARRGADAQARVPQFLADGAQRIFRAGSQRFRLAEKKQIDVGVGIQGSSPVTADRQHRETRTRSQRGLLLPQLNKQFVYKLSAVLSAGTTRTCGFEVPPNAVRFFLIKAAQCGIESWGGHSYFRIGDWKSCWNAPAARFSLGIAKNHST